MKSDRISEIYAEIGKRIVTARESKSISQMQLAEDSGIDRSHMGFIEQGHRRPTISTLYKIVTTLNMTLEELFKGL